ncbi:MAG TPA: very short patch repair endonuclease [Bacteroidales bacterium]|nr:very short patch repair endonuclease [Bacteroidales bacterium]
MDILTKEQRRRNMQAIRSQNTKLEQILGHALWNRGYRYRKCNKKVYGKPDFTLTKYRLAIFVDSEFFHGKDWETQKYNIQSNRAYWWTKIERNIERDIEVTEKLKLEGWNIIRFWGKDVKHNLSKCFELIESHTNGVAL